MSAESILADFGVTPIGAGDRLRPMTTKALAMCRKIVAAHGPHHLTSVLRVIVETNTANRSVINQPVLMAVSDVLAALPPLDGDLLDRFDAIDLADLDRQARRLEAIGARRTVLATLIAQRLGLAEPCLQPA